MRNLLREPLVQFLLLGLLLFAGQRVLGGGLLASDHAPFVVDDRLARWIAESEARSLGRAPSEQELRDAVQRYARGEALRREARRLGLDRGDPIVERRLEQKMEFLLEGAPPAPTDEDLAGWLAAHPDLYSRDEVVALEHRFFGGERATERAQDPEAPGDPFVAGSEARGTMAQLDARFGPGFGAQVFAVQGAGWSAPIPSRFGLHRVRVLERAPGGAPELDEVRERVRRDLLAAGAEAEVRRRTDELVAEMGIRIEADLVGAAAEATP